MISRCFGSIVGDRTNAASWSPLVVVARVRLRDGAVVEVPLTANRDVRLYRSRSLRTGRVPTVSLFIIFSGLTSNAFFSVAMVPAPMRRARVMMGVGDAYMIPIYWAVNNRGVRETTVVYQFAPIMLPAGAALVDIVAHVVTRTGAVHAMVEPRDPDSDSSSPRPPCEDEPAPKVARTSE